MDDEAERLARNVAEAWNNAGVAPAFHNMQQLKLIHEWETLGRAIDELAKYVKGSHAGQ